VFRKVSKPSYDRMMADQLEEAAAQHSADLDALLAGGDSWVVS